MRWEMGLARRIVRAASRLAPEERRQAMVAEWEAELVREAEERGERAALLAALGAFSDGWALRRIGRDRARRSAGDGPLARIGADLRVSVRTLLRTPGFTAVSIITLAVGLGSVSAVYTLVDRIVLDPLPYPDADRLVRLQNQVPGVGPDEVWALSTAQWVQLSQQARTLRSVALHRGMGVTVVTASGAERARAVLVTGGMLPLLGAQARLGRLIGDADDQPGAGSVVVLSEGFWRRSLGADPAAVGRTLSLNGQPVEIIGVLEGDVRPPAPGEAQPDLWVPLVVDRSGPFQNSHVFPAVALLEEGVTPADVEDELRGLTRRLPEAFPEAYGSEFLDRYGFRTTAHPLRDAVLGDVDQNLWVLFGGVLLVLLVAAANVANLFLVRVESRRSELALRRALGADGGTVMRYVLSESLILSTAGGVLAVVTGVWAVPALRRLAPEGLPRIENVAMGWETVVFTLAGSLLVGVAVAIHPLLTRTPRADELTSRERTSSAGPARQRARGALVVSQMALAIALLVGAGLLVDSLDTLRARDPGFEPEGVLAVELFASQTRYPDGAALWQLHREILDAVRAIPGVTTAGMGEEVPVTGGYGCTVQGFENTAVYDRVRAMGMTTCAGQERVTPGYFEALRIPLLEGRYLEAGDNDEPSRAAVVVSRAFAERFWPGESALGKGVAPGGRTVEPWYRVVGVVGDVAARSGEGQAPLSQTAMAIYYPVVQTPETPGRWGWWWAGEMTLVVRTDGMDAASLLPAVRRAVDAIDPEIPLANARPMEEVVAEATAGIAFLSTLLIVAALCALLLAAVGLYGVISWVVSQRTREIGMRLAIGAAPSTVVRDVVLRTLRLAGVGLLLGMPLAWVTSRVGRSLLVGVESPEPTAYLVAGAAMLAVSLLAGWIPARRAAAVDPAMSLRGE